MASANPRVEEIRRRIGAFSERELAATILGGIALAGSLIGYATFVLPHPEGTTYLGPSIAFAATLLAGGWLWLSRSTVGWTGISVVVALGSVVVTIAMLAVPDRTGAYASYYVWLGIFAFYFLKPRWALVQVGWIGFLYAGAVAIDDPPGAVEQWLNGFATTLGVGLIVLALRARIAGLLNNLETAALTDVLTGLPNRRAFDSQLERELQRSIRSGEEVALAMLDLDHFKELNDSVGHLEGDDALEAVARIIEREVRTMDWPARLGGDEFALLLPRADRDEAMRVAERLGHTIRQAFGDAPVRLSASLGLAVRMDRDITAKGLLDEADTALYAAKRAGGNRVELAAPGPGSIIADLSLA